MVSEVENYEFDDISVDLKNFRVIKNGKSVALAPRAFDVLKLLLEKRGDVAEKQEIFDSVWGDVFVGDNALTKAVKEIRQALGDDALSPRYIETVPKRGYRFIAELRGLSVGGAAPLDTSASPNELNRADPDTRSSALLKPPVLILSGLICIVLLVAAFLIYRPGSNVEAPSTQIRSLAVLPLRNLTGDTAQDYLCDGVTESLITSLSQVEGLKVIARGSSFAFKDKEIEASEIGTAFGVETVLMGSLQKRGDILLVSARLVETVDGRVLWATEIQRPVDEIFALQSEIARNVIVNLDPGTSDASNALAQPTDSVEAYKLYLQGRYFWHQQTEESLDKSIELFTEAASLDPGFVLAYAGLSDAHNALGFYFRAPNEVMPRARLFAAKALELNELSADAHYSMASYMFWYERDWTAFEREINRTLELAPNHPLAHNLKGDYLVATGRKDDGIAEIMRAIEFDPLAHFSNCDLAWQYYNTGQNDKAISYARQNLETVESCPFDRLYIGQSLGQQGKYAESLAELTKIKTYSKDWAPALAEEGYAYGMSGQTDRARKILWMLTKASGQRHIDPFGIAIMYVGMGDHDSTFLWLEKALEERSANVVFLNVDSKFANLRGDPRFLDLSRRLGMPLQHP